MPKKMIVPLKRMSVGGTSEVLYLGFHVPRMELKIMATILDETGVDSGGLLMGCTSLGMKKHTRIRWVKTGR